MSCSHSNCYYQYMNRITGSSLRPGEVHAPQRTKKGWQFGNYIGPNTHIIDRAREDVKPVSKTDKASKAHDIRLSLATSAKDVNEADKKMIKKLQQLRRDKEDYTVNTLIGELPIRAKLAAEDIGMLEKGSFSDKKGVDNPKDKKMLEEALSELEQEGYGKKLSWVDHVKAYQKANNCSYKEAMRGAKRTYKK